MTDSDPYLVDADCPACDDGLAGIVWPPGNPDAMDVACYFCKTNVEVARDGEVTRQ